MHYYQFNIGDYKSHTDHLDPIEDITYRRMIDYCYLHESGLPLDVKEIGRAIRMRSHCEVIETVLSEFFCKKENGYFCKRIEREIKNFRNKSKKAAASAKARWAKHSDSKASDGMRTHSEGIADAKQTQSKGNTNHKPRTINQEPLTKNQSKDQTGDKSPPKNGTRIPNDFCITQSMQAWADKKGFINTEQQTEMFIDYWKSERKTKLDWAATWRVWMNKSGKTATNINTRKHPMANENFKAKDYGKTGDRF